MDSPLKFRVIALTALGTFAIGLSGIALFSQGQQINLLNANDNNTQTLSTKTPQSVEEFKTAYEENPTAATASAYAHRLMVEEKWQEAQEILSSTDEKDQTLLYQKALFNVLQNHPETAQKEFEEALKTGGPLSPATLQNFITVFTEFEKAQGGEPTYLKALLCKALVDAEEFELAALLSKQVLSEKNDYRDVWILLGYSKLKMEAFADAEDAFRQAKKIDSLKPEVHYFLGSTLSQEQKYEEAVDELELALLYGFEPAEEAYKKIAEAHTALKHWTDAVAAHEALLSLNPSTVSLFQKPIELCLEELHDADRAATLAQKAIAAFPQEALGPTLLAKVYLVQNKLNEANEQLNRALELDANFALAHYTTGQVREQEGNGEAALWEYKKTFELTTEEEALHSEAATAYNRLLTHPLE